MGEIRTPRYFALATLVAFSVFFGPLPGTREAEATLRFGPVQISGNFETLNLIQTQGTFDLQPIAQRNTFRLQYEHQLVDEGTFLDGLAQVPFLDRLSFFAYYRAVYDSIYDIAPGGRLRTQDGGFGGRLSDFNRGVRSDIALENVLREVYIDAEKGPLSLRIGRQQIVWGNAINFRALDANNPLDLSWHLQQEAGLLGKSGFSELRTPAWGVKILYSLGTVGPLSNTFLEAYDYPFGTGPSKVRFLPHPFSLPVRNPFRAGLIVNPSQTMGLPLQACFDTTGNTQPNAAANTDGSLFSEAAMTGFCDSPGLQRSRLRQGIYDRGDPGDVNQFGARIGTNLSFGLGIAVQYVRKRSSGADMPGATVAKVQFGAVTGNQLGFVQPDLFEGLLSHDTTDPITRETTPVVGYVRIPIEFYYPYVDIPGIALDYYDDLTQTVYNLEVAYEIGVPVATAFLGGNGINRKDLLIGALLLDRQQWIRFLNPRSTFTTLYQVNFLHVVDHQDITRQGGTVTNGDVGLPNANLILGQFGPNDRLDRLKEWEVITLFVMTTFYKGGSVLPLFAWIADWSNAPSMEFQFLLDYYVTNNLILGPGARIFTNFGRNVDEPFGVGRLSQNDEIQLRMTYQF